MKCSQGLRLLTCLYRSVELVIEKRQSGLTMSDSLDHNPNTFMQMPGSTLRVIDLNNELQQTGSGLDRCKAYEKLRGEVKSFSNSGRRHARSSVKFLNPDPEIPMMR